MSDWGSLVVCTLVAACVPSTRPAQEAPPAGVTQVQMTPVGPGQAPPNRGELAGQLAGRSIPDRLAIVHGRYGEGRQPVSPVFQGTLEQNTAQDFSLTLQAGGCYTLIGVGVDSLVDLDILLFDANGTEMSRDQETDNYPVVTGCPSTSGAFFVRVLAYEGSGEFGLQVYGAPAASGPAAN